MSSLFKWLTLLGSPSAPTAGRDVLDGRYALGNKLGAGGFGEVYRARQLSTGQEVAIKLIRPEVLREAESPEVLRERFRRETAIVAQLNHPHVVGLVDAGETDDGRLYTVYEFVDGETLTDYLSRRGPLSRARAKMIMVQVLDALACAHEANVVHRDLKPDNIMLREASSGFTHAVVLDFGIATLQKEARGERDWQTLTATGAMPGTPAYMAPEQVMAPGQVGPWSDVYAWGLIYIECLTGTRTYTGETPGAVMLQQAAPAPVPIPAIVAGTQLGLALERAVNKNIEARFANATDVLEALPSTFGTQVLAAIPVSDPKHRPVDMEQAPSRILGRRTTIADALNKMISQGIDWARRHPSKHIARLAEAIARHPRHTMAVAAIVSTALLGWIIFSSLDFSTPPTPSEKPPAETTEEPAQNASTPTPPTKTCEEVQELMDGECCWPGQVWDTTRKQCVGVPRCPSRSMQAGEGCEPLSDREWEHHERCRPQASQGRDGACGALGALLQRRKAHRAAARVYSVACERGRSVSCNTAAASLRHDSQHADANRLLELGCSRHHAPTCHTLATHIQHGRYGLPSDWPRAEALFKQACTTNDPYSSACRALARSYLAFAKREPEQQARWINEAKIYLHRCKDRLSWCGLTLLKLNQGELP